MIQAEIWVLKIIIEIRNSTASLNSQMAKYVSWKKSSEMTCQKIKELKEKL